MLSRVALTDFSTALERALKNRSAAPASLPCFRHWRRSAPLQVLLSAVECFQKDYCKRKETAFLESCRRSGSPPGRRSYRPRNRGLTKAPLGLWLRHKCRRPVQVLLSALHGSPPGRRSYRPRNRALTNSPLGCWLPRLRRGRAVQVLLSAQKEKLSTLC